MQFIKTIPVENKPSVLMIKADFLLTHSFSLRSLKWEGEKTEVPSRLYMDTKELSLTGLSGIAESTQTSVKAWHRGTARVGSARTARKGTRAACQRLKSNLSLLGLHTPPCCQQNGQMKNGGAHKVGDGSLSQTSSGAAKAILQMQIHPFSPAREGD